MRPLAELIGDSPGLAAIREQIGRLLQRPPDSRRLPAVLIQGETGTGKGLLARAIHRASPRAAGPFVDVNCAAIPETLLESEMFGFERGAFTDARQAKPGLFQAAHRGTIFLDEVGLLPEGLQAKLLTVIEEHSVRRLGSTRSEPVDVWVLAATSEDLLTATRARRFREDLYHRLAVLTLWLPPLRERGQDILLLAEHFLARACTDYALSPKSFTSDARAALLGYRWPGNIRELANVMERITLLTEARSVTAALLGLPTEVVPPPREPERRQGSAPPDEAAPDVQRQELLEALQQTNWNVSQAAALLGISRNTLRYRIEKYGLHRTGHPAPPRPRQAQPPAAAAPAAPAVPAAAAGTAPAGLRWEQRSLTLLRATLAAPEGEPWPPGTSRALEVVVEKVRSFGGRVEELSPRGVAATFGVEPAEDAPSRAAHAAMAIQKAGERARRADPNVVGLTVAIHTSQFMVGRLEGAVQLDQDAKREAWAVLEELRERAEADTIVVSEATAPLLERRFDLVPVVVLERAPGRAYRLTGRERTGLELGRRMASFVGRQHELALLRSQLASVMRGDAQVVGIVGEPGIGKSRLLFEFRQGLVEERVRYLEGHCVSYGTGTPYLPIVDILQGACGISEGDAPEAMSDKVRSALGALEMDPEEGAPYLLHLLGLKEGTERVATLSPEAIQARTFETLRQMSLRASRQQPLILVVENCHWVDRTSEEYLTSLVDRLPGARVLLVLTYRPGYQPPWAEKSYASQIALRPLSPQDSLSMVQSFLRTSPIPDSLAEVILGRAEGNPFFLEELALAIAGRGESRAEAAVPDTVQEVLLARIDRLPEEVRRLLQTASVLGREVSLRLLGAIWEGPGRLDQHLRELTRLEFLHEQPGAAEPVYVFKHALTREVARESLPPAQRMALHAAAGRALETFYADRLGQVYDRLAYHYSKAKQFDRAVQYLSRFAENAARSYAHLEAVRALEEAMAHGERVPREDRDRVLLDLVLRRAASLSFLGRFRDTLDLLLRERPRLERLEAPKVAAAYHFWLSHTYSYLGDHERAVESAHRATEEAERAGDEATLGKAYLVLAQESSWSGGALEGVEHGRRAVELLERAGERWWLGLAHWIVGINHITTGGFDEALEAEGRARAVGESLGDPRIQSYAAWSTGWIHALTGEWEAAIEACQRGLGSSPDPVNTAVVLGHLGYAYLEKGDPAEAIRLLERSVEETRRFGFLRLEGRFMTFLGEAYLLSGEIGRARELVGRGLEITREVKYWYGVGWARLALGRIARVAGALDEAARHLAEALETFTSVQARFMVARTHLALAELAHAREDRDTAAVRLRDAYRLFEALGVPRYAERARHLAATRGVSLPH